MGARILVVEDNQHNVELVATLLSGAGYEVRVANDAAQALGLLETFHPALILMDLQLPGMDGLELTRKLKADPKRGGIVVLAYTAYALAGDEQRALDAGADGYIVKPVPIRTLLRTIEAHLARRAHPAGSAHARARRGAGGG